MVLWRSSHRAKCTDISISPVQFLNKNISADADRSRELQLHEKITPASDWWHREAEERIQDLTLPISLPSPFPWSIQCRAPLSLCYSPQLCLTTLPRGLQHGRVHDTTVFTSGLPSLPSENISKYFIQISGYFILSKFHLKQSQNRTHSSVHFLIKPVTKFFYNKRLAEWGSVSLPTQHWWVFHTPTPQPMWSEGLLSQAHWRNPYQLFNHKAM